MKYFSKIIDFSDQGYEHGPDGMYDRLFQEGCTPFGPFAFSDGLNIVGARPGMGKTTLMIQSVVNSRYDSYIYSPLSSSYYLSKRISRVLHLTGNVCASKKIYLCEKPLPIEELCEELKDVSGVIYIDDLQHLYCSRKFLSADEDREYIEDRLLELSRGRCVTVLSQVNENAACRAHHLPDPTDIRFYEDIYKIADRTMTFVYRDYYDGSFDDEDSDAEFAVFDNECNLVIRDTDFVRESDSGIFRYVGKPFAQRELSGFSDGDLCNMSDYLSGLIPAMLKAFADKADNYKKECGSPENWKKELLHGAELWENVVTEDYPDDDNVTVKEWQAERKEKLHRAMAWLEENFFDLWD